MKKGLATCLCMGIIGLTAYYAIQSHSNNSNASTSYEYYYNNNGIYKDSSNMEQNGQLNDLYEDYTSVDLPAEINTDPDSLTVFVNKEYSLPQDYIPEDLVEPNIRFYFSYFDEKRLLREDAADALETMISAAKKDGLEIVGVSGYRSYQRQKSIYNKNVRTFGQTRTDMYSAVPGYSEHQTGWSIDLSCAAMHYDLDDDFAGTKEGKWLAENCCKYGFIIRYPKGKESITGYAYEPWHVRYVGRKLATYLTRNDMTLEDYYGYTLPDGYGITGYDRLTSEEDTITDTPSPKVKASATPSASPKATKEPEKEISKESTTPIKKSAKKATSPTPTPTAKATVAPTAKPTPTPTVAPTPPSASPTVAPEGIQPSVSTSENKESSGVTDKQNTE